MCIGTQRTVTLCQLPDTMPVAGIQPTPTVNAQQHEQTKCEYLCSYGCGGTTNLRAGPSKRTYLRYGQTELDQQLCLWFRRTERSDQLLRLTFFSRPKPEISKQSLRSSTIRTARPENMKRETVCSSNFVGTTRSMKHTEHRNRLLHWLARVARVRLQQ